MDDISTRLARSIANLGPTGEAIITAKDKARWAAAGQPMYADANPGIYWLEMPDLTDAEREQLREAMSQPGKVEVLTTGVDIGGLEPAAARLAAALRYAVKEFGFNEEMIEALAEYDALVTNKEG